MKNTLLWAIDPLEAAATATGIKNLILKFQNHNFQTKAIHVAPNAKTTKIADLALVSLKNYKSAQTKLNSYLATAGVKGASPAVVSVDENRPLQKIIEIEKYADTLQAKMLMLSSHRRTGLNRAFIGSFAETVLLNAKRPVLFLPKKLNQAPGNIDKILFATDFSPHSREAFHHLLPMAKALKAEIVIFHVIRTLPIVAISDVPVALPNKYYIDLERWAKTMAKRWSRVADDFGVTTKVIICDGGVLLNICKVIHGAADTEKAGMIAGASASKNETTFVLGSVARDLIRDSKFPLWLAGPYCDRKSAKAIWSKTTNVKRPPPRILLGDT